MPRLPRAFSPSSLPPPSLPLLHNKQTNNSFFKITMAFTPRPSLFSLSFSPPPHREDEEEGEKRKGGKKTFR